MARIEQSVDVDVPVRTAYNQWTQFEEFPEFMEGVKRIVQKDDRTLEWTADIAGQEKSWEARITEQTPDQRVAWKSTTGADNAGVVTFHRLGEGQTRINVQMDIDPEGPIENVGTAIGAPDRRVKGDLDRFKKFIETRGQETGAWRGSVDQSPT